MATIRDVAALAGVSPATVSRVINGGHPVKASTRRAVEKAIRTLDFQPNINGRNLSRHENRTILVITSSTNTEMYMQTLHGINMVLVNEPYDLLTSILLEDPEDPSSTNWDRCARFLDGGLAGGVLLFGSLAIEVAAQAAPLRVPVVQCSENVLDCFPNSVSCNNQRAVYELTRLLIAQGRRRFGFISSRKYFETEPSNFSRDRLNGMKQALAECGLPYYEELTTCSLAEGAPAAQNNYADAVRAARFYAALPAQQRPDAIVCATDRLAFACVSELQRAGIAVPQQVAVTGFDNSFLAQTSTPQLTTIQTPNMEMGAEAARLLISLMRAERPDGCSIQLPHRLIERGSSNPALP